MSDYARHCEHIETALNGLLKHGNLHLNSSELAEVSEFIGHNEYGLAVETLSAILVEHGRELSHAVLSTIEKTAVAMGMVDQPIIVHLLARTEHHSAAAG